MKLPYRAIGIKAALGKALHSKKPHLTQENNDKNATRVGQVIKYGADKNNPDGFTLGQVFNGISIIQRYSRGYLKKLRRRILLLHERERAGLKKREAIVLLQRWFRRYSIGQKHKQLADALKVSINRKHSRMLQEYNSAPKTPPQNYNYALTEKQSTQEATTMNEAISEAERAIKLAAEATVQRAILKEQHARELHHIQQIIAREMAASRIQLWFFKCLQGRYTTEVARHMRLQMVKLLQREKSINLEQLKLQKELTQLDHERERAVLRLQSWFRNCVHKKHTRYAMRDMRVQLKKVIEREKSFSQEVKKLRGELSDVKSKLELVTTTATKNTPSSIQSVDHFASQQEPTPLVSQQLDQNSQRKPEIDSLATPNDSRAVRSLDIAFAATTPRWKNDAHSNSCMQCKKQFTWFTRQHHCRQCGDLFCQECSAEERAIPVFLTSEGANKNDSNKVFRVCDKCRDAYDAGKLSANKTTDAGQGAAGLKQVANTDAWGI